MGDRQRNLQSENMATTSTAVTTVPPQLQEESVERVAMITLKPARDASRKKVVWTEDTVDNENMNKKKSKCCCIYEKPRRWDESDSESDDECENCYGHVERRHKKDTDGHKQENTEEKTASMTVQPQPAPPDRHTADT